MQEKKQSLVDKAMKRIEEFLGSEIDLSEIKAEMWEDLSLLYYKYDSEEQKRAFREIMYWIAKKINEDKWDTVYQRLYRKEKEKEKAI